jgi:hypothetical protein
MKTERILIQGVFSLLFVFLFCQQVAFPRELTPGEKRRIESGAIDTFETIISLWKREKFDEIYEYGDRISRQMISKEIFISDMRRRCKLAYAWETVQDIEVVQIISSTDLYLKAKLGFRGPLSETIFCTQVFKMTLEDKDQWRIDLSKIYHCCSN